MKKIYWLLSIVAIVFITLPSSAQINVYNNTFPGSFGPVPIPGGTPAATFTTAGGNSSPTASSGQYLGGSYGSTTFTPNQLALWVSSPTSAGTNNGYAQVTAPMAGYSAPFTSTLSSNIGMVTWTFNMSTSTASTGFGVNENNAVTILAATDPAVRTAGNGYAVAFDPGVAGGRGIQLVKYTGGLTGTVTTIISASSFLATPTEYASIKVEYLPTTNQWTLYIRDDGPSSFIDPATGILLMGGANIDATYTGTAMSVFGCYANYSVTYDPFAPNVQYGYFDNFNVTVTCPEITGGLSTCIGLTTTLSNAYTGGTWSSSTPSVATVGLSTGIVTGITAGTATITHTSGLCVTTAVVTVNPLPVPPAISGVSTVCVGQTTNLLISSTIGTWSSSNPAIGSVGAATGVVTGVSAGTVIISYTIPSGCFSTRVVSVNALSPIIGSLNLCVGQTVTFSDAAGSGTWTSSTPAVATIGLSTGFVTPLIPGTTVVTFTTDASCVTTSIVTVNPLPEIVTGTPTVCQGFTTTLSSTSPDLTWTSSSASVASVDGFGVVTGNSAGTAIITYKLPTSCLRTIEVTVNPAASISGATSNVCIGATITLNGTPSGGTWTSTTAGVTADVGLSTGVVSGLAAGTSVISYILPTGCFRFTTITVNPLPTPITGTLTVCQGLTTTLSSGPAGGTWTSSSPATGTVSTAGVVTGILANTVTITYTIGTGTGCYRTAEVTVNPLPSAIAGNGNVCEGATRTLTSSPTGGSWATVLTTIATVGASTGVVAGVLAGTTNITYTAPTTGCKISAVVTVIPQPTAFTGSLSVCMGSTVTLGTTPAGATWTSGTTSVATIGLSTGVVTPVNPGNTTITGTGLNGCTRTAVVTVNALPSNITGTTTVCSGATTTLSSSPSSGTWSSLSVPVAFFASSSSGVMTGGVFGGTTTVSYILSTGCYKTTTVTVNALPTVSGNTGVCIGLTTTWTGSPAGTWASSNITIAAITAGGVITGAAPGGTATISYTATSTGCVRTREVSVNALPGAISGSTSICPGSTVTLSSTPAGGTWSSSVPAVGTINTVTGALTGLATGNTTITYTLPTTCITTVTVTVITAPPAVITPLGDTSLCPGGFVALTASTLPGVNYEWYESGNLIPGALAATYLTYAGGSYQVKVSVTSGCSTLSVPMSVSIVPSVATITLPAGSSSGCSGAGVLMEANLGTGLDYQWVSASSGVIAGATSSSFNALSSGTYSVIISNSSGCSATSTGQSITINTTPSALVTLSGPLAICYGSNVTMSVAPGMSYQWYNLGGSISGATNSSYNASTAESYWVQITSSAGCTATSAMSNVVVNPLPNVSIAHAGSTVFCAGGSVNLGATPGFNYQWYQGGIAIPGATNMNYVASAGGGYKVRVTDPATGCTDITHADTVVTVVSSPTVVPLTPAKFCWGGSSLLSTSVSGAGGAILYQWSFNGATIAGANGSTYNATEAGDYSCSINVPSSCAVTTTTVHVYENPLPDPLVSFDGVQFHTGNFYVSYQWYKNLTMIPGAVTSATPATSNGSYKVAVTDTNGCQSVSTFYVLTGWSGPATGVTTVNETGVKIYPNPASNTVHIESAVAVTAIITSMDGRTLRTADNAKDIDISKLANGVYMIMVYDVDHTLIKTEKLVKAGE